MHNFFGENKECAWYCLIIIIIILVIVIVIVIAIIIIIIIFDIVIVGYVFLVPPQVVVIFIVQAQKLSWMIMDGIFLYCTVLLYRNLYTACLHCYHIGIFCLSL